MGGVIIYFGNEMLKLKLFLLYFYPIFILCGCSTLGLQTGESVVKAFESGFDISFVMTEYYAENHRLPETIDELKIFYYKKPDHSISVDWDMYKEISIDKQSDGGLQIKYLLAEDYLKKIGSDVQSGSGKIVIPPSKIIGMEDIVSRAKPDTAGVYLEP